MLILLSIVVIYFQSVEASAKTFIKTSPMNRTHMEVHFQLPPKSTAGKLNGFYSLHHESCEDTICGGGTFDPDHSGGKHLRILASLSPCENQSDIFVKLHTWNESLVKKSKPLNYVKKAELRRCQNQKSFKPLNSTHMEVKFKLPPSKEHALNGTYTIHHVSCPASVCGGGHFATPQKDNKQVLHITTSVSPCFAFQDIIVRLYTVDGKIKRSKPMSYRPLSLGDIQLCNICNQHSVLSEDLAAERFCKTIGGKIIDDSQVHFPDDDKPTSTLSPDEKTSDELTASFFEENNYQNAIIIGCCSVALILAIIVTCFLVKRRKKNRSYDLTN